MKRLLLFACLLFVMTFPALASYPPVAWLMKQTDNACFATVTAVDGDKITFTVTKALAGNPGPTLQFQRFADKESYTPSSEWLLVSYARGDKGIVGWNPGGFCEWTPIAVHHDGDKTYLTQWNSPESRLHMPLEDALKFLKKPAKN